MKTVAIVGTAGSTRHLAPYKDKGVDIWMFNSQVMADWAERVTAIIQIQPEGTFLNQENIYTKFLAENKDIPVYMQEARDNIPASIRFPLEEITVSLLPNFTKGNEIIRYFTSSVCYAIALAIYQGYERIEMYGVDMANNTEYLYQRDGIALWFGIALGRGIQIYIPNGCLMFNAPLYGYSNNIDALTREDFERIASELQPMIETAYGKLKQTDGIVQGILIELEAMKKRNPTQEQLDAIGNRYSDAMNNYQQAIADYASFTGQYQLARQFQMRVEKQMEAQGRIEEVIALKTEWKAQ